MVIVKVWVVVLLNLLHLSILNIMTFVSQSRRFVEWWARRKFSLVKIFSSSIKKKGDKIVKIPNFYNPETVQVIFTKIVSFFLFFFKSSFLFEDCFHTTENNQNQEDYLMTSFTTLTQTVTLTLTDYLIHCPCSVWM